ncbi:ABC transporter ATP-binding protein [Methylobacterium organophilum]|uniref:dipeptide ABC transporter ATP-binding protein n=1 Tax=Methylobacterium organophilum TaxID=410 RepID=UPI001F12D85D|nr:ABC transporter ATP-binding protein [Methylobacterium organophilum]UMY16766.1 ABC transporter ATP-binding protein [Methylobacterium organophilum]
MLEPVLSIQDLTVRLPRGADRPFAVEGASLTVNRGEIVCIVGESGSGKSILSSAIMGAIPRGLTAAGGRILFGDEDMLRLPEERLRRIRGCGIAMIFQEPMASLNPAMTVAAQIGEMFEIHEPTLSRAEIRERVLGLLRDVQLPDPEAMMHRLPHQLSGGQCQRVVIAMALSLHPRLLIADEPTTALDVTTQAQILNLVRGLRDRKEHGILFITHDFGVVADIADRVVVMRHGRIVEQGTAEAILSHPSDPYTRALLAAVPSGTMRRDIVAKGYPILSVRALSKRYGQMQALDRIDLEVLKGQTVAIVGESGSGKSTLARSIIRLVQPTSGQVVIEGRDFAHLSGRELNASRRFIQMIFQDPFGSLNPQRTVGSILERAGCLGGLNRAEAKAQAERLVREVGLPVTVLARKPGAFSGGQRQRIGIARALAMRPKIIIADESVSALDVSIQKQVLDLLDGLRARTETTMLFITHDLRVAAQIADTVIVMRRGQIVESGSPSAVLSAPKHAYTRELVAAIPGRAFHAGKLKAPAS